MQQARKRRIRKHKGVWPKYQQQQDHYEDLHINKSILKLNLETLEILTRAEFNSFGYLPMAGCCECGIETGSLKYLEYVA
jgi:hypothetical protein